jgi:hypothetical protein
MLFSQQMLFTSIFLLLTSKYSANGENWCPQVSCSRKIPSCTVKWLILAINQTTIMSNVVQELMHTFPDFTYLGQGELPLIVANVYSKVNKFHKKSLDAFAHNMIPLHSVYFRLQRITESAIKGSAFNHTSIYVVQSQAVGNIPSFDRLRHMFPCSRLILYRTPLLAHFNANARRFFPSSFVLTQDKSINDIIGDIRSLSS